MAGGGGEKEASGEGCDEMHNPNTMCGSGLDWHHPMVLKLNIQKTKIMASSPITSWQIDGETVEIVADFILGARKSLQMVTAAMKLKDAYFLKRKL